MPKSPLLQPLKQSLLPAFSRFTSPGRSLKIAGLLAAAMMLSACGGSGGGLGLGNSDDIPEPPDPDLDPSLNGYQIGSGSGEGFMQGMITASTATVGSGNQSVLRVNVVNASGEIPSQPVTINFTSGCVSAGQASFSEVTSPTPGLYRTTYTNNGCQGSDTVRARIFGNGDEATVTLTVTGPEVFSITYQESTFDQLALAGLGGNESTEVTFLVSGAQGVPVEGEEVSFSISTSVGSASIAPGSQTAVSDQDGLVRTRLNSGTVAGPVNVRATHLATGKQGLSNDIIISTGVVEAGRFSISYDPFNPAGAWNMDGVEVEINIIASDTFGNNPTDGTRVTFVSPEAGNVTNFCELIDGGCSVTWRSSSPRPVDGRVEVLAYTDGAEAFVDNNGNSVYDAADGAIQDLGEPYADENENGIYDLGEFFFDTDQDGIRDTGNGQWDGPCLDAVDVTAVCDGNETVSVFSSVTIVMSQDSFRVVSRGNWPTLGGTIGVPEGASTTLSGLVIGDSNTNALNPLPAGSSIDFSLEGSGVTIQGQTSYNIANNLTSPTGPYGITLAADPVDTNGPDDIPGNADDEPLPTNIRLIMTIQTPNVDEQQISWAVNVFDI